MNNTFFDAGHWLIDAGQGEPHHSKNHKAVFINEWEFYKSSVRLTAKVRKNKKVRHSRSPKVKQRVRSY